jgi:SAM-dependent methyltransferase
VRGEATSLSATAITVVVDALRRGEPWRRALEAVAVAPESEAALEGIASEACGNWVWLTSFVGRDAALDIGGTVSSMAPALSRHFRVVHHLEASTLFAEFAARRFAQDGLRNILVSQGSAAELPFPDEAFDCLTLHGVVPRASHSARRADAQRIFTECRRVLRPGGRIYVAAANPLWYGRRLVGASARSKDEQAMIRAARGGGFRDLERYYAFPTFDRPRELVPATRRASYARETVEASGTLRGAVRRATALVGLYTMLAPAVVFIARK